MSDLYGYMEKITSPLSIYIWAEGELRLETALTTVVPCFFQAAERHTKLDGVYKLLCGAVQCAAELGEDADGDSVIAVYRKLVDTRDTIMEFLYSVADQELYLVIFTHCLLY